MAEYFDHNGEVIDIGPVLGGHGEMDFADQCVAKLQPLGVQANFLETALRKRKRRIMKKQDNSN